LELTGILQRHNVAFIEVQVHFMGLGTELYVLSLLIVDTLSFRLENVAPRSCREVEDCGVSCLLSLGRKHEGWSNHCRLLNVRVSGRVFGKVKE